MIIFFAHFRTALMVICNAVSRLLQHPKIHTALSNQALPPRLSDKTYSGCPKELNAIHHDFFTASLAPCPLSLKLFRVFCLMRTLRPRLVHHPDAHRPRSLATRSRYNRNEASRN